MKGWQLRVVEEAKALKQKIDALGEFTTAEMFKELSVDEQGLLNHQHSIMEDYLSILEKRIDFFKLTEIH